jgi:hypothetical protein
MKAHMKGPIHVEKVLEGTREWIKMRTAPASAVDTALLCPQEESCHQSPYHQQQLGIDAEQRCISPDVREFLQLRGYHVDYEEVASRLQLEDVKLPLWMKPLLGRKRVLKPMTGALVWNSHGTQDGTAVGFLRTWLANYARYRIPCVGESGQDTPAAGNAYCHLISWVQLALPTDSPVSLGDGMGLLLTADGVVHGHTGQGGEGRPPADGVVTLFESVRDNDKDQFEKMVLGLDREELVKKVVQQVKRAKEQQLQEQQEDGMQQVQQRQQVLGEGVSLRGIMPQKPLQRRHLIMLLGDRCFGGTLAALRSARDSVQESLKKARRLRGKGRLTELEIGEVEDLEKAASRLFPTLQDGPADEDDMYSSDEEDGWEIEEEGLVLGEGYGLGGGTSFAGWSWEAGVDTAAGSVAQSPHSVAAAGQAGSSGAAANLLGQLRSQLELATNAVDAVVGYERESINTMQKKLHQMIAELCRKEAHLDIGFDDPCLQEAVKQHYLVFCCYPQQHLGGPLSSKLGQRWQPLMSAEQSGMTTFYTWLQGIADMHSQARAAEEGQQLVKLIAKGLQGVKFKMNIPLQAKLTPEAVSRIAAEVQTAVGMLDESAGKLWKQLEGDLKAGFADVMEAYLAAASGGGAAADDSRSRAATSRVLRALLSALPSASQESKELWVRCLEEEPQLYQELVQGKPDLVAALYYIAGSRRRLHVIVRSLLDYGEASVNVAGQVSAQ